MNKHYRILGNHDEKTVEQFMTCLADDRAVRGVLCADGHLGYNMPIGGVIEYDQHISPAGVGFDIGCGNTAMRIAAKTDDLNEKDWAAKADEIANTISFGIGRVNEEEVDHALFDDPAWKEVPFLRDRSLRQIARNQLGTVGSGNHYVDVFTDESGDLWVGVHFGSRGLGHKIASHFITEAGGKPDSDMMAPPVLLATDTEVGQQYVQAMRLAGEYARAGRHWVCQRVKRIFGDYSDPKDGEWVENNHNFAWEHSPGRFTVRKGATPAEPGQAGFVGGSMGDMSVILEGTDTELSEELLHSTVHGAGRVMSRRKAAGKFRFRKGKPVEQIAPGLVDMDTVRASLTAGGLHLRGAGADEAPEVYRNLGEVLDHQGESVRVRHRLTPKIVVMAGAHEFDPYKD